MAAEEVVQVMIRVCVIAQGVGVAVHVHSRSETVDEAQVYRYFTCSWFGVALGSESVGRTGSKSQVT